MEIIVKRFVKCVVLAVGLLSLAPSSEGFAAGLTLQKIPPLTVQQASSYPENLARYNLGAQVEAMPKSEPIAHLQLSTNSDDHNGAEAALLCSDPTVGYALPAGVTTVLVSLPKIENLGSISFLNKGAKGSVTVASSSAKLPANSAQWKKALEQDLAPGDVHLGTTLGEAKYLRLTFNMTEPGRIAGFGVYANPQVSDFTAPRAHKFVVQDKSDSFALISYNYGDVHAEARALYVSSGTDMKQANNMIDDQPTTAYSFAADDATPTAVIDLGQARSLRRLSVVYSARPGHMDFYVLQSLPSAAATTEGAANNTPNMLQIDDSTLANLKPVGSVDDNGSQGHASIDFPETSGRYVMVRWTPAGQANGAFSLAEVAAFGRSAKDTLLAQNNEAGARDAESNSQNQMSDGKTMLDGKTVIDTKDVPGEGVTPESPAEGPPPSLPQPPPFTFVPLLVPTSP